MKLKRDCKLSSLARILPFCAVSALLSALLFFFGGNRALDIYKPLEPPVYLKWEAPADETVESEASFIFEPYATAETTENGQQKESYTEYLYTNNWDTFMGLRLDSIAKEQYEPLIKEMQRQAKDGETIEPIVFHGVFEDMGEENKEYFYRLIEGMGYLRDDAAISLKVLHVNKQQYIILDTFYYVMLISAAVLMALALLLLLFTLFGGFQSCLGRRFNFRENRGRSNRIDYKQWTSRALHLGDLYLSPEIIIFHSFAKVVCIKPRRLDKAVPYPKGKENKKVSKYLYFYAGKRKYKVLVGKKNITQALQYIFRHYPNAVSI